MQTITLLAAILAISFPISVHAKAKTKTIETKIIVFPEVSVKGIDYAGLTAEFARGSISAVASTPRSTEKPCAWKDPETGRTKLKTTKMMPVHYYRVNYKSAPAYMTLKNSSGEVIHAFELSKSVDSWEDFGKVCGNLTAGSVKHMWKNGKDPFLKTLEKKENSSLADKAQRMVNNVIFFKYNSEKIKLAYAADKKHDYSDLDKAFSLAQGAYDKYEKDGYNQQSLDDLKEAIGIWEKAVKDTDFGDKKARINRKVALRLHQNIGTAAMFTNEFKKAARHLNKAESMSAMSIRTSGGTGITQVLERVQSRKKNYEANLDVSTSPDEIRRLFEAGEPYKGKIKVKQLENSKVTTLASLYKTHSAKSLSKQITTAQEDEEEDIASGAANAYQSKVTHTVMQGFMLILRPMPFMGVKKLTEFPKDICRLEQLNQLDMVGHVMTEIPSCIGKLVGLKKLNLSKNKLSSLPDSIAKLKNLKKLTLKKNSFSKDEQAKIKGLLPNTKIKF